jgi:hypothetical protein
MNPVVEEAIVVSCDSDDNPIMPHAGKLFAEHYDSLARAVIDAREILTLGLYPVLMKSLIGKILSFLAFGCEHPSRRKRTPVDVQKTVDAWAPLIKKLAIAHDIDEKDAASSALDELLLPIVAAPVSQIREFYKNLTQRLKSDPEIPWAVWKLFIFWGENVLDRIDKEEMVGLKTEIAKRIAQHSMEQIPREDWINSMVGALQWRDSEKLQEIESALESGQKPKIRGKESCLFLQIGEAEVML